VKNKTFKILEICTFRSLSVKFISYQGFVLDPIGTLDSSQTFAQLYASRSSLPSGPDLDEQRTLAISQVRPLPKPPPFRIEEDGRGPSIEYSYQVGSNWRGGFREED
jgi:hypothetical protein